jgi:hypothetical protein
LGELVDSLWGILDNNERARVGMNAPYNERFEELFREFDIVPLFWIRDPRDCILAYQARDFGAEIVPAVSARDDGQVEFADMLMGHCQWYHMARPVSLEGFLDRPLWWCRKVIGMYPEVFKFDDSSKMVRRAPIYSPDAGERLGNDLPNRVKQIEATPTVIEIRRLLGYTA